MTHEHEHGTPVPAPAQTPAPAPAPRRLAVLYEGGSASPVEIADGLGRLGEVVYVLGPHAWDGPERPLIEQLGETVRLGEKPWRALADRPDAVLTFSEPMLRPAAALAAHHGLPFHPEEATARVTDKFLQRQRLREAGVDAVRCERLASAAQWPSAVAAVGLPAVVKPARGAASRNTHRVRDAAEGAALVAALLREEEEEELVVEQWLSGSDRGPFADYVSVESAVCDGAVTHLATTGKFPLVPPFREPGQFWPALLDGDEERAVRRLADAAVRALGLTTGLTHTEIKLGPEGPRIIEVNGRLGGFVNELSTRSTGVNLIELAGRLALGERPPLAPASPGRVFFQRHTLAPEAACRLVKVHGAREIRRRPHIDGYRLLVREGTHLANGVQTGELDILCGSAADHAEMLRALDAALDDLAFTVETPNTTTRVEARSLPAFTEPPQPPPSHP